MLTQFANTEDATAANFVSWICGLGADSIADFSPAIALAQRAVDGTPQNASTYNSLGAVLYRAGRFAEARKALTESDRLLRETADKQGTSPAYGWYFLAMTYHRLGDSEQARHWLGRANEQTNTTMKQHAATDYIRWNRRATLKILQTEAQTLITPKPTASPSKPKTEN